MNFYLNFEPTAGQNRSTLLHIFFHKGDGFLKPINIYQTMWHEEKNRLQATFTFKDFAEAFAFMTEVALRAEQLDHHPDWSNAWNKVEIQLTTHSAGSIVTEKDRKLAATISVIAEKYLK